MVALAAERWNSDQPQTVTLKNRKLFGATLRPVWQWQGVARLDLSSNNLRVLPENIHLPNLKDFNVSDNELKALPNRLLLLPSLVTLDLSHNNLRVLPKNINLPNLKDFDLSYNKIQKLPTQLHLPSLSSLDISHNRLRDVAAAMMQLCGSYNLTSIGLKGNNLIVPPSQIIERGSKKVCQYFKDLARGRKICWSQTVLVVGQEQAGKTALCHALNGHECADHAQMTDASTVGIDTVPWSTVVAIPRPSRSKHIQSYRQCTANMPF